MLDKHASMPEAAMRVPSAARGPGFSAGEQRLHETISQVRAELVDTPAKTLAGLIFKARHAATHIAPNMTKM
jgi:hypothetical protein